MPYPTADHIALLRSRSGNRSRVYLGVQRGKERTDTQFPLMVGHHYRLEPADLYDTDEHTLTFTVGSILTGTDIRPNMTLAIGTEADPFLYGSTRIRYVDVANNRLCLERNNLGAMGYFVGGNYIWVDGVYRLYRKLPYIVAGVIYEDGNPDTALAAGGIPGYGVPWNANYYDRPVALMGSPRFAWTGEAISFYGWRSYARGGRSIQNWTWDFDGGTCVEPGIGFPGSPSGPVRARWDTAGEYIASLVVEDDSGNNANDAYGVPFDRHRAVRPVLVYDRPGEGSTPPYTEFEVESLSGRYGAGWSARITVYGTADKSEFPDNALIILYAEDWYNDVRRSLGGWYGQEGVLFVGHIRADSVTVDSEKSTVSFEAATIDQWMRDVNVWPANFSDPAAAAAAWREFDNMIVEDTLWHLSEMSSNLKDVTDCFFSCGEKALHFVDLTEGSLYDQMSEQVGSCFFGQLSASRQGSIHLFRHKNMMTLPERLMYGPPLLTFTRADWRDELEIGEERQRDSVAQVDFIGFIYDAGGNPQEVYSLAPLRQLNFGGIEKVTGTLLTGQTIVAAQGENDTLSGLYLAWKNIRFPHLRIPAPNNRILEPATQDYFAVDLAEADTTRGFDWDGKEFLCTGMSLDIDNENGFIEVDIEGEASTWGPDGVAGEYPTGVPVPVPDYGGGGGPPGYLPELPPAYEPGTGDLLYMLGQTRMYRTENAWAPPADVVYADLGQIDGGAAVNWFALDSWHPATRAMVVGDDGIYRTSNLDAASPTWERVVDLTVSANIWAHDIVSSICQENLWMATVIDYQPAPANRDLYVYWTVDFGDTWNNVRLTRRASYSQAYIEASSHNAQVAWVTYFHGTDTYGHVVKTTDQWGSYTDNQLTLIDTYNVPNCYHRYFNNPSDDVGLYVNHDSSQICSADYAACTTGVIVTGLPTDIDNWCGGYTWGTGGFWALTRVTGGQTRFHVSDDGSTWAIRQTWPWAGGPPYCVSGWPYDPDWVYAGMHSNNAAPLELSTDRGVTWASQTGNWATLTDETIVCLAPVWVA